MNRRFLLESLLNISQLPQLATPTISLDGDNLVIEEVENAEYYDIYVDGVLEESIDVRPPQIISFSVTLSEYQAESGMTWSEWITSNYNSYGYYIDDSYSPARIGCAYGHVQYPNSDFVQPTDVIISNYEYDTTGGGSND